jgi:hypothetical protein
MRLGTASKVLAMVAGGINAGDEERKGPLQFLVFLVLFGICGNTE